MIGKGFAMNRLTTVALLLGTLVMSGCASMSADECAASDWRAVGYEDGSRGYTSDRFSTHRKACAKHGMTADFSAYQQGRGEGLVEYCQPSRGYNVGASGGYYHGVCPAELESGFLNAYRAGQELYTLRANVNSVNSAIYSKEAEIEAIEATKRDKEAALIAAETTVEDRVLLLKDLALLSERKGELEAEIEQLLSERAYHEQQLQAYEQSVVAYDY